MIVEDNTMVAEDCRECLESLGYSITSILASGEESIVRAEIEQPDAVLLDIHLRDEMDGIEAAEQIYSRFQIPVMFLSAYSDPNLLDRAKRVGSFGYLIKPFKENELCAMLEMTLYKANAGKNRRQMEIRLLQAQKMEAISTLSGGIAHQFNNALYTVSGNIDLLKMDFPDNERIADYTGEIMDSVQRMMQLTAQLLAYAKGGKYKVETIRFCDFIRKTVPLLQHVIDSGIHLHMDLPHDIFRIQADLNQMQMVLSNVLINASEAMEGKGRIRIACRNTTITKEFSREIHGLKPGNYVCLSVTDDGSGMNEETRARIFEPFFTTKFQGRGLGMAAVYGIIENHHGGIVIASEPGRGTTVRIYLPAIDTSIKKTATEKTQPKSKWIKGSGTILVIDDEKMILKVCRTMLNRLGYDVLEAKTGKEAIKVVSTFKGKIDLAMLDILLPDMNGNMVYPFLMDACPNLKVLVFSGYCLDGPAQGILDAGAQGFIQKPFSMAALSEKLMHILKTTR